MSIKTTPDLHSFLSTYFPDADPEADEETVKTYISVSSPEVREHVIAQAKQVLNSGELSLEELGIETNRWFGDVDEAMEWISRIVEILEGNQGADPGAPKDSNGAVLSEGDSVQVIKDLKVKGGTSDLKRGTLIRKIHLIGDPENVECRVDGSTLVLKTCFLKKA